MNPAITIPETAVYADEAPGSLVVPPNTSQFHQGVEPEMTLPAAWWNYFTKLFTETNIQASADIEAILTELNNLLITYGYTPDAELDNQLSTLFGRFLYGDNAKGTTKITTGSLNSLARSGFYQYETVTDYPGTLSAGIIIHAQFSDATDSAVQFALGADGNTWFRAKLVGTWQAWARVWSSANDGINSGLDADLFHGQNYTNYAQVGPDGWPLIKGPVFGLVGSVGKGRSIPNIRAVGFRPGIVKLNDTTVAVMTIEPNAAPYYTYLRVYSWSGLAWTQVGDTFTLDITTGSYTPGIALLTADSTSADIVVTYQVATVYTRIRVLRWNFQDHTWTSINTTDDNSAVCENIAKLTDTDIIFCQSNKLWPRRWDGSAWTKLGAGTTVSNAFNNCFVALTTTRIVYIGADSGVIQVYNWDPINYVFTKVGTDLTVASAGQSAVASLNETDILHIGATNEVLKLYRWDPSTMIWSIIGTGLTISTIGYPMLAAMNATDAVFIDTTKRLLSMYKCI